MQYMLRVTGVKYKSLKFCLMSLIDSHTVTQNHKRHARVLEHLDEVSKKLSLKTFDLKVKVFEISFGKKYIVAK